MKNKIKSFGFWTALSGAVVVLVNALGRAFGFYVQEELITDIIMALAGLLVVLGVVTMPKGDDGQGEEEEDKNDEQEDGLDQEDGEQESKQSQTNFENEKKDG